MKANIRIFMHTPGIMNKRAADFPRLSGRHYLPARENAGFLCCRAIKNPRSALSASLKKEAEGI